MEKLLFYLVLFILLGGCSSSPSSNSEEGFKDSLRVGEDFYHDTSSLVPDTKTNESSKCECKSGERIFKPIKSAIGKDGLGMLVCGYKQSDLNDGIMLVSALSVYDCKSDSYLVDFSNDETHQAYIRLYGEDSLSVLTTQYVIIDSNWNVGAVPLMEKTMRSVDGRMAFSNPKFVFDPPTPTRTQIDSILKICAFLESKETNPPSVYPLNEKSIYMLLMGATSDLECARAFLTGIENKFILDGAIAETIREMHIERILGNISN